MNPIKSTPLSSLTNICIYRSLFGGHLTLFSART